jgi:hypothetical protein
MYLATLIGAPKLEAIETVSSEFPLRPVVRSSPFLEGLGKKLERSVNDCKLPGRYVGSKQLMSCA